MSKSIEKDSWVVLADRSMVMICQAVMTLGYAFVENQLNEMRGSHLCMGMMEKKVVGSIFVHTFGWK